MISEKIEEIKDTLLKEKLYTNLGRTERILSIVAGGYIRFKGVRNNFQHP